MSNKDSTGEVCKVTIQMPAIKAFKQRFFINDRASCIVYQDCPLFHFAEFYRIHESFRFFIERDMDA